MKNAKARVYIEFVNHKGEVIEREPIAEFCSENWADEFVEAYGFDPLEGARLAKEIIKR